MSCLSRLCCLFPELPKLSDPLMITSFVCVSAALTLIAFTSISSDFTYLYVFEHSSGNLDPIYRLSAVWAGGQGALLVCTWFMSLLLVLEAVVLGRRRAVSQDFRRVTILVMSLLISFFSFMVLMSGMFDYTPEADLMANPDGLGMDVLLQTPEMVAHAPLIFGAYAALALVFSASVSHSITGDALWFTTTLPWGRVAWLLLTAGIGLGAVWAYYVIGWGGYWSWDPVETSSLIPWLMITAFLHTQTRLVRGSEYGIASPLFGMMSFAGVVFVSFVVRAGGLWDSSVHDYGEAAGSSAASRLVALLQQEPSLAGMFAFLVLLVAVAAFLSARAYRRIDEPPNGARREDLHEYVNDRNTMLLAITLLVMMGLVAVLLMFKNIQSSQDVTFAEFNQKMTFLFVALAVTLGLCLGWKILGRKRTFMISVSVVILSIALAVIGAISLSTSGLVLFAVPSFLFAMVASVIQLAKAFSNAPLRTRFFRAGAHVTHLGIAILLLSHVAASNLQSFPVEGPKAVVSVDGQLIVKDYVVRLTGLTDFESASGYPAGVTHKRTAYVDVYKDGRLIEEHATLEVLYGYDPDQGYEMLERVAFIRSSVSEDLYMSFEWITGDAAMLHVKVVPMMAFLWTGIVLVAAGLFFRFFAFESPRSYDKSKA
ncbi:MAG: cytochrome c biogenesis protein CcsA [Methanobacteriota archaeon]|nr:MAG: cytochrome c biogenesis protein CcsA [Euryarchaeota archaeon]